MNKKSQFLLVVFFISIRLIAQNNDVNIAIKKEASLKAFSFLNLIPAGKEKEYGFIKRDDFSKIKIEEPYKVYYVSYKNSKLWFLSGNEWRVPISVNGEYVTLLTVQFNNGTAEVIDFGGNILAHKIQEFEKLNLTEPIQQHVIIRNTFLKQDFITTKFSLLFNESNSTSDLFEININTNQPIYQINKQLPIKTSVALFCSETIDFIINSNDTK